MRKILLIGAMLVAPCGVRLAYADAATSAVKADVGIKASDETLRVAIRLHGVASGQTLRIRLEWKAPDVFFTNKKGEKTRLFGEGGKLPSGRDGTWHVGDPDSPARCWCKDTGEKGCWHGDARFTIQYDLPNGKTVRAVGTWTMNVVDADSGVVLGTASYDVK